MNLKTHFVGFLLGHNRRGKGEVDERKGFDVNMSNGNAFARRGT